MRTKTLLLMCLLALSIAPAFALSTPVPTDKQIFTRLVLYHALLELGKSPDDAAKLSQEMSLEPDDPFVLAMLLINQGQYEEAISMLNQVPADSKNNYDSHLWKAYCYFVLYKEQKAFEEFRWAESKRPDCPIVHLWRSFAYSKNNQFAKARSDIEFARRHNQQGTALYEEALGSLFFEMNQPAEALSHFNLAVKINPNYADAYSYAGQCYLRLRNKKLEVIKFKQAVSVDPTNPVRRVLLGIALNYQGEFAQALEEYDSALKIAPTLLRTHECKGDSFIDLRNWKQAIEEYTLSSPSKAAESKAETSHARTHIQRPKTNQTNQVSLKNRSQSVPIRFHNKLPHCESSNSVVLSALAWLPDKTIQLLREHGITIVIAPTVKSYELSMKHSLRPLEPVRDADGVFIYRTKEVIISNTSIKACESVMDNITLVLHELGHAYDSCSGSLADSLPFKLHYARDVESLNPQQRKANECYLEGRGTGAGQLFADLFAVRYGDPRLSELKSQVLNQLFPRTYEYMCKILPLRQSVKPYQM